MKWISVDERLPEKGEFVLLSWEPKSDKNPHGCFWGNDQCFYNHKTKQWQGKFHEPISHWMPLPNPPHGIVMGRDEEE